MNPLGRTTDARLQRLIESGRALEHLAGQTRGVTRGLADLTPVSAVAAATVVGTAPVVHEVDVEHGAHVAAVTGTDSSG